MGTQDNSQHAQVNGERISVTRDGKGKIDITNSAVERTEIEISKSGEASIGRATLSAKALEKAGVNVQHVLELGQRIGNQSKPLNDKEIGELGGVVKAVTAYCEEHLIDVGVVR